jgi:nicotinate-nucleotide--dimethylbenzimidazole phosphoribosyltransferase
MSETRWQRPVPVIGDRTSAATRSADPSGWAFDEDTIEALRRVIAARRDVRRYRPDAVADDLLRSVLAAGHQAPSVGHSQPWRFIVVQAQETRDRAAVLADRERLRQADLLTPDRRARLLDLQLEGIREAPIGLVVTCDRRTPAAGVLGRATFPDTDLWSCACAIQNMWLAARAVGLGLGWVTLFQPADLARLLGLPDGIETLGWLCLGWPDERPPEPGLERQGWSQRVPVQDVVLSERWPTTEEPDRPVSHLAGPKPASVVAARDTGDDRLAVPGSLGLLDQTINRVLSRHPQPIRTGTLVLAAADHRVAEHGISAYATSVTADVVEATRAGTSLGASTARAAGLHVVAVKAEPLDPTGDLVSSDALSTEDVGRLIAQGRVLGRDLGADGLVCLGEVGIGNTTVAATLTSLLLHLDANSTVGLGASADAPMIDRKRAVVTSAVDRVRASYERGGRDPRHALAAVGGAEIALLTGVTLGAAEAAAPIVLDGLVTSVAALLAVQLEPAVQASLVAGQLSREAAHPAVLTELGLEPLLQLRLRAGEGVGACLAAQLVLSALRARSATVVVEESTDEGGVSERDLL